MRLSVRFSFLALLLGVVVAFVAPAAAQAAFGVQSFFASNCKSFETRAKNVPPAEEEKEKAEAEGFTQAGGHPNFGITDFTVATKPANRKCRKESSRTSAPTSLLGVSTNPQAVAKCSQAEFGTHRSDRRIGPVSPRRRANRTRKSA